MSKKEVPVSYHTGRPLKTGLHVSHPDYFKRYDEYYKEEYYRKHGHLKRERGRAIRKQLKLDAIKAMGGRCVHCKTTDFRCIQIDHIYNDGYKERFASVSAKYAFCRDNPEEAKKKFQLLCVNCNTIKKYEYTQKKADKSAEIEKRKLDKLRSEEA